MEVGNWWQMVPDGQRWWGGEDEGLFSWSNSRLTTLHPLFPLHLDFRWPTLCWVVTLETALRVFIKRDCRDMEKRSSRQDVFHDRESTHGGCAKRLLSLSAMWCHRHLSPCSGCWFLFSNCIHKLPSDPSWKCFDFSLIWGLTVAASLKWRGSESLFTRSTLMSSALGLTAAFFFCNLCHSLTSR